MGQAATTRPKVGSEGSIWLDLLGLSLVLEAAAPEVLVFPALASARVRLGS